MMTRLCQKGKVPAPPSDCMPWVTLFLLNAAVEPAGTTVQDYIPVEPT
jgi:hypothetical protein